MYLISGCTYGERIVHRSDHRHKSGRWLQRKHTPRFRARTSARSDIIWWLCKPPSQFATVVYDKGSGVLPLPLKGMNKLSIPWYEKTNFRWESKLDPHLRNKRGLRSHHFNDPRNPKVVKSDLWNNDEVVICHPTRGERNVHSLAHSKNGNMLYNSEILLLQ